MDRPGDSRRSYLQMDALDPLTGGICQVQFSQQRLLEVARRGLGHARECGEIVPLILQHPEAVFEGIRKEEDEDRRGVGWRCYSGVPLVAFDSTGEERNPYPGQVYLVFVNDEGVVYNWRWEKADAETQELPKDYQTRFRKRLK